VLYGSQVIVTNNRVYLLGGYSDVAVSTVYTAPINGDGTLGTWTTGTSLPGVLYGSQVIVTNNRVYLLGGYIGVAVSTVYTAPIEGGLNDYTGTTYIEASDALHFNLPYILPTPATFPDQESTISIIKV